MLLCWLLSGCIELGQLSSCGAQASLCKASLVLEHRFYNAWASAVVEHELSSCGSQALEHRLNTCGTQSYLLLSMWDLPGPGIKPTSIALADRFFSTEPPGKPSILFLILKLLKQKKCIIVFKDITHMDSSYVVIIKLLFILKISAFL